jgi:hypothetical protein
MTPDDYVNLVTGLHRDKPKFTAMLRGLAAPFTALQDFIGALPQAFDLDTAIGAQLDALGLWVGRSRYVEAPLPNVWFSFDTPNLGWEQGSWLGPFDPVQGLVALDDDTYRLLLRAKIAANDWDSTISQAASALQIILPNSLVFIQDTQDMQMLVGVAGNLPSAVMLSLLSGGYIPLKPEGVQAIYYVTSVDGSPLFGFDVENQYVSGFDVGAWGTTNLFAGSTAGSGGFTLNSSHLDSGTALG